MRWIGLNDGYVSADGRFLVAQVTVHGRRGLATRWALYGLVRIQSVDALAAAWRWSARPLYGPVPTKRACQEHAMTMRYEPPVDTAPGSSAELELDFESESAPESDEPTRPARPIKRIAYEVCQECSCDYKRPQGWIYDDYCGPNCFAIVVERVQEIQARLARRVA